MENKDFIRGYAQAVMDAKRFAESVDNECFSEKTIEHLETGLALLSQSESEAITSPYDVYMTAWVNLE